MSKKVIVDAKGDSDGDTVSVLFKGNSTYTPVETAIDMAKKDQIENAHVSHTGRGVDKEYLRTNPNGVECDNLDHMVED